MTHFTHKWPIKHKHPHLWADCGVTFPADTVHGATCGKRYRYRADCDECVDEAWERMMFAGLSVQHVAPVHARVRPEPIHWLKLAEHERLEVIR